MMVSRETGDSQRGSSGTGLGQVWKSTGALILFLVALEFVFRLPPVYSWLSDKLDPYENLLWYYPAMVAYQSQLRDGPHYDVWILGSSYAGTSLDPQAIQNQLSKGNHRLRVQNYTFSLMQNLADMSQVVDRWMLPLDKPRYVLLGIHMGNASPNGQLPSKAHSSTMERAYIFQDTLDDIIGGFIYRNSTLFRYLTLSRNALTIDREETVIEEIPLGGYVANKDVYECDSSRWTDVNLISPTDMLESFQRLDSLISVLQSQSIQVSVVGIPTPFCGLRRFFVDQDAYVEQYLELVSDHLQLLGIPYEEFDRRFFELYPESEDQLRYYNDATHPNEQGAAMFSTWASTFLIDWLNNLTR